MKWNKTHTTILFLVIGVFAVAYLDNMYQTSTSAAANAAANKQ